jgi:hypothetical protein
VSNGLILKVEDGWIDTYADFYFDSPNIVDTPDSVTRSEYRCMYSGDTRVMLTVTRETAKQQLINLQIALNGGSPDTTRIT